jgi:hypothetical protein
MAAGVNQKMRRALSRGRFSRAKLFATCLPFILRMHYYFCRIDQAF